MGEAERPNDAVEAGLAALVRAHFDDYARLFNAGLAGTADPDAVADLYAEAFIAASPAGVMAGQNGEPLKQAMAAGFARYRAMGTTAMRLCGLRLHPIDAVHCLAHVDWQASYAREGQADVAIDFQVHYLVQVRDGHPRVFGWVSGDETALLRAHGIG